jgi:hypothetical protein
MIVYDKEVDTSQALVPTRLHCVHPDPVKPLFIFLQDTPGWCPYRKIVTENRTIRVRLAISESVMRRHMLYHPVYIRAIYGHSPLVKEEEQEYDMFQHQVERQLVTEHEFPVIDEFGMHVYVRLEIGNNNQDVDLRYTEDTTLEKLYHYDICDSKLQLSGVRMDESHIQPSLVST